MKGVTLKQNWGREPGLLGEIGDSKSGAGNVHGTSCHMRNETSWHKVFERHKVGPIVQK